MDIATIIGLIGGTTLVLVAVLIGSDPMKFLNLPALLIVFGGTFATCFIKFTMEDVINSFTVAMKAFTVRIASAEEIVSQMVDIARIAKKDGLIALERINLKDEFAAKAIRYLADGYDEGLLEKMLDRDIRLMRDRHLIGQKIFRGMGTSAPAFGMIGTLIGLVDMMVTMKNPDSIGPSMAMALLTTLYGALLAHLVCLPLSEKLELRSRQEEANKRIIIEAAIAMSQGVPPIILEDSLRVFLSPKERKRTS